MMNQNKEVFAIIPSAGFGTRFDSNLPKQYFKISQETIIEKTLKNFLQIDRIKKIIVPINNNDDYFSDLDIAKDHKIQFIDGGDTRAESVLKGLENISPESIIIVHDVVRPF
ncbi:MAG: 2-C-methyl-D-erythritol 4-phosphate cytidylyltransferase, partial [Gammaproteobacteria bacterium]|nr:2-C-methyl-D-erythritol 4-phosphate cytidylyltransferase [Gammaproteobacteria bacterium]